MVETRTEGYPSLTALQERASSSPGRRGEPTIHHRACTETLPSAIPIAREPRHSHAIAFR